MFEDQKTKRVRADSAHVEESVSFPKRKSGPQAFDRLLNEKFIRHGDLRLSPEATAKLFKDVDPDTLAKISPDHLRRIAFNASVLAEWVSLTGGSLAGDGIARLTQRFALNMLKQSLASWANSAS